MINEPDKLIPDGPSKKAQLDKLVGDKWFTERQRLALLKLLTNHGHNISAVTLGHLRSRGLVSSALGYQLTAFGRELAEHLAKTMR